MSRTIAMTSLRVLAVSVASGRVGYVFLIGGQLMDWQMSRVAARSTARATGVAQQWIADLEPSVVVTEKPECAKKKGERTKEITMAIAAVAAHNYVLDIPVARAQSFNNKYEEAAALAKRFPELLPWVPKKRRFFDNEPRETVIFEALSLALVVIEDPATEVAAEMS